jgi:hypothetical protein
LALALNTETIYVALLGEGVDVWRPVDAIRVGEDLFRIIGTPADETEAWQFPAGSLVRCAFREFQGGNGLVAYERAANETPKME